MDKGIKSIQIEVEKSLTKEEIEKFYNDLSPNTVMRVNFADGTFTDYPTENLSLIPTGDGMMLLQFESVGA